MADSTPKISTIDQLLNSRWGRMAQDPEIRRKIPGMLRQLLDRLPTTSPVVERIRVALRMFEESSSGALLNSRNILILSAALLYTFWPADAMPDVIPVIGWLDDIGLLTLVISAITGAFSKEQPPAGGEDSEKAASDEEPPQGEQ